MKKKKLFLSYGVCHFNLVSKIGEWGEGTGGEKEDKKKERKRKRRQGGRERERENDLIKKEN